MATRGLAVCALTRVLLGITLPTISSAGPTQLTGVAFDRRVGFNVSGEQLPSFAAGVTVAAWVNLHGTDRSQVFLNRGKADGFFTFYLFRGHVRMLVAHEPGSYTFALAPPPTPGIWTHYAGTYDGECVRVFRNGQMTQEVAAPGALARLPADDLFIGALDTSHRFVKGHLEDLCLWNRALTVEEVHAVADSSPDRSAPSGPGLVGCWQAAGREEEQWSSTPPGSLSAESFAAASLLLNVKADGFRGIWYANQASGDEYVYKYSGGLGTYCAKHIPHAWYAPAVGRTFFCYGGTDPKGTTLLHSVSYYDHAEHRVARPTVVLDKKTTDAHDNPVMNIDDDGYVWIFSSSHGTGRPSFISRSVEPYSIDRFECVWEGNFSYPQPVHVPGMGFLFLHTRYSGGRALFQWRSSDGVTWAEPELLARIDQGHYQVSRPWRGKVGTAFNFHPAGLGLNWRTNVYYMETPDFGKTWRTVGGEILAIPLTHPANPALAREYRAEGLNVYLKDLNFDSRGNPIILILTSRGYESGPENMPRTWRTVRWTGTRWDVQGTIVSDNNYDMGSLYIETDDRWRLIAPTQPGPQSYNPGGEVAMWVSRDLGESWSMTKQLTQGSQYNHTYVRRPVNAHPGFYGFWADGHGRKPSDSRLYFCTREGAVFRLPPRMTAEFATPERVR